MRRKTSVAPIKYQPSFCQSGVATPEPGGPGAGSRSGGRRSDGSLSANDGTTRGALRSHNHSTPQSNAEEYKRPSVAPAKTSLGKCTPEYTRANETMNATPNAMNRHRR